jgi:high affinity sulfate transporter 1
MSQESIEMAGVEMDNFPGELDNLVENENISLQNSREVNVGQQDDYLPLQRTKCPIPEPVRSSLTPPMTKENCVRFILFRLPILSWLWSYKPRYLVGDVIAGITVAVMHIPQGLAYALLASLPPVYGLYTSFIPPIVYALFGTSRHLSVGTFAVVSLMIGQGVDRLVLINHIPCEEGSAGSSNATNITDCVEFKSGVAITITFLSGTILIVMSIFQLGFVSLFLSSALVSGYTTGAAVHVATSQVRHLLGIPQADLKADPGPFNSPKVWILLVQNVARGNVNVATINISLISCIFLIVVRNVNSCLSKTKLYKKIPIPIPSQLILVVLATLVSYLFQFNERWGVSIVDTIKSGPPQLSMPVAEHIPNVIQDAITVAIVSFAVGVSLSKVFAKRNKYEVSANQEMFAYGISNVLGSFFSSFGPSGSLSRSLIQENVGGKTQLVGIISSVIIFAVLIGIAPLFEPLPKTILASVVIVALYGMFKQVTHLLKYWKTSKFDMAVWLVIFIATVVLGVDYGLLVGTLFSVALVVFRILLPNASSLGQLNRDSTVIKQDTRKVLPLPGIIIFRFFSPLCYLNTGVFRAKLVLKAGIDPTVNEDEGTGCWKAAYNKVVCCVYT